MKRFFLTVILVLTMAGAFAQNGGVKGKVVSREGREAVGGVKVSIEGTTLTATTDDNGAFIFDNLPGGTYTLHFATPEFE